MLSPCFSVLNLPLRPWESTVQDSESPPLRLILADVFIYTKGNMATLPPLTISPHFPDGKGINRVYCETEASFTLKKSVCALTLPTRRLRMLPTLLSCWQHSPSQFNQSWRLSTTNTPCMRHVTISHLLPILQASCDNLPSYSKVFILKVIYGTRDCSMGEVLAVQT